MAAFDASATLAGSATATGQLRSDPSHDGRREGPTPLEMHPTFCPVDVESPFDTTEWELRTAAIKGEDGKVLFEQPACEIPAAWSQLATNVVVSKYFYGEIHTPEREHSVKQLVHRVARTIADWGIADGYFKTRQDGENFYRDLSWLCVHQHGAFNSPVWFNVGLFHQYGVKGAPCNWRWDEAKRDVVVPDNPYEYPQGSACFIQSVKDNMEDIMELARSEAMLFKFGSGTGTDLSTLRSQREKLAGGGKPSGPLSFMRVYDQVAAVVKKDFINVFRLGFTVDVPGPDDLEATGSLLDHEYTFRRGDRVVAQVSKQWFSLLDTYGVEIAPGEDDVLVLASTVVIDMIAHPDAKPAPKPAAPPDEG